MQAARGKAAQSLWQAYVAQRGHSMMTMPSSKSLWDVVNRQRLEPHGAEAVGEIWMEVRRVAAWRVAAWQPVCLLLDTLCSCDASTQAALHSIPAPPGCLLCGAATGHTPRLTSAASLPHQPHKPSLPSAAVQFHADPSKNRIATVMSTGKYAKFQEFASKR
jgi:hypothetical protein